MRPLTRKTERLARLVLALVTTGVTLILHTPAGYVVATIIVVLLLHSPDRRRIPVVTYHSIRPDVLWMGAPDLVVPPEMFSKQMEWLSRNNFTSLFMDELQTSRTQKEQTKNRIAIHFDDGYQDTLTNALPIFKEFSLKGTVFVSPGLLVDNLTGSHRLTHISNAFLNSNEVQQLHHSNTLEVQSHGWSHTPFTALSNEEQREELTQSKQYLERLLDTEIKHICFPRDALTPSSSEIARKCGYSTYTGGTKYNATPTPEVSRIYITTSGITFIDELRFICEIRVFQGWYWLFPLLWVVQQITKRSWKQGDCRVTP